MHRQRVCRQWLFAMLGIYSYDRASSFFWETSDLRESMRLRVDFFFFFFSGPNAGSRKDSELSSAACEESPGISGASGCREYVVSVRALNGPPGQNSDVAVSRRPSGWQGVMMQGAQDLRPETPTKGLGELILDIARSLATGGRNLATSVSSERDSKKLGRRYHS